MSLAYHSGCCPLLARELSALVLEAYKLYHNARGAKTQPDFILLEQEKYRLHTVLRAKVLPLSRFKPFGFVATQDDRAYVIFRGTEAISEWVGDSRFLQVEFKNWGKVHKGFHKIYETCSESLMTAISQLGPEVKHIYLAGHSLGAALTTMACIEIIEQTNFKSPIHYTFASPRVGNLEFATKFQEMVPQSFRIINTEDIVITEPKAAMVGKICQYAHVGLPFAFTHHGGSIIDNHLLESYISHL